MTTMTNLAIILTGMQIIEHILLILGGGLLIALLWIVCVRLWQS